MSEGLKIVLTAFAGIAVFTLGQIIQKLFIEPIQDQWKLRGKIIHALSFYSMLDKEKAPPELVREFVLTLRDLASQLQATTAIPAYKFLSLIKLVLKKTDTIVIGVYLVQITYVRPKDAEYLSDLILRQLKVRGTVVASEFEHRRTIGPDELAG